MQKLIRRHGELYLVDKDYENHCSLYVYIDYTALDWMSFIFCDAINPRRAKKSIRLEPCMPVAVNPTHPIFRKTKFWNINEDGYDKILMNLLSRKNSQFPAHTNWERMRILYLKHDRTHGEKWWESRYHDYEMPDYTNIYGTCNWEYMDNDPDDASWVEINRELNISIYSSGRHCNTLRPEEEEESGFLVFDDANRYKAKRVAKISVFKPEYLYYHPNSYACKKSIWHLNTDEKKILLKLLKMRHRNDKRKTNWQILLENLKRDGFIKYDYITGQYKEFETFIPDLPMSDYTLLPD